MLPSVYDQLDGAMTVSFYLIVCPEQCLMPTPTIPLLQTNVPDWLALGAVVASVILAAVTLSMMVVRLRPSPDEDTSTARIVHDPVLLISALSVIGLAVAAWLLR
jgi:hypothetical protein